MISQEDEEEEGVRWSGWEARTRATTGKADVKADKRKSSRVDDHDKPKPKRKRGKKERQCLLQAEYFQFV
jgi:hypothetical protein